jgi:hypothetical protein
VIKVEDYTFILKILSYVIILLFGGLGHFLYTKSPKLYFWVSKITSKWKDTNWEINAGFTIPKSEDFFKKFEGQLTEIYGRGKYRRTFNLKNKKLYEFSDFAVTVQYDLDLSNDEYVDVEFLFNNINVTVNTAEKKLRELRRFFHQLERSYEVLNKWYNIKIKFTSLKNPFFGLMIQRMGEEHVEHFECSFPLSILSKKQLDDTSDFGEYKLTVYKDYISINDSNFDLVEEITKKCLLLR